MRVVIDKFGRILLPKRIREHMGLRPGTPLEVETRERSISLRVLGDEGLVEETDGLLVFRGETDGTDLDVVLRDVRGERIRRQSGR